ncbi:MAG TPA: hypothetical protein VIE89_08220 [Candidatus Binatia bacterium]|jgi:prolipoprotein diacylglyceryltransferase
MEFVKENQVPFENHMVLDLGQLLSIPFILAGIVLIYLSYKTTPAHDTILHAKATDAPKN